MNQKYEIKTYGVAKVMLEAGEYTVQDLIKVIEGMGMLNQHARAQIDAVTLSSDPAGLKRRPPQFPTMLRKMWSGTEVQEWINENWK